LVDLVIEPLSPSSGEDHPIIFARCALLRELVECLPNGSEWNAHSLRGPDKGQPA
jgi:hypothetical protein